MVASVLEVVDVRRPLPWTMVTARPRGNGAGRA
jgi:hypothetical protein